MKKFMSPAAQILDIDVAFPCDIDLRWYLVPKTWVRQLVSDSLIACLVTAIESWKEAKNSPNTLLELEVAC